MQTWFCMSREKYQNGVLQINFYGSVISFGIFLKKNSVFSFSLEFSKEVSILSSHWEILAFKQIFLSIKMVILKGPEVKHLKWLNTTNSKWDL